MKIKFTRAVILITLLSLIFCSFVTEISVNAEEKTKLVIHYHRPDQNYEPWNLWIWPYGQEGKVYYFTADDPFGKVATVELPGTYEKVGFIVRTDEWKKDITQDRFITEFIGGIAEIWLISGDPKIYTEPPEGFGIARSVVEEAEVIVHYYRYDGEYAGWNLWLWPEGQEGKKVEFTTSDSYGMVATTRFDNLKNSKKLGLVVRKSTPENEWLEKDVEHDRFIPIVHAVKDGKIEIWLMQREEKIGYNEKEINKAPRILAAIIDEPDLLTVNLNIPITLTGVGQEGFTLLADGKEVPIKKVTGRELIGEKETRNLTIETKELIDLGKSMILTRDGYRETVVKMGKIFDSTAFSETYHYEGDDLGAVYSKGHTFFRVWAPTATALRLITYEKGQGGAGVFHSMKRDSKGTWVTVLEGDCHGLYYTYEVTHQDAVYEVVDPYAKAVGANGDRGMVIDLSRTNPDGWEEVRRPPFATPVDAVIYELHIRDLSSHENSGIVNKGKFLGLTERGTRGPQGVTTGLDHLKELGITHLHLLPAFDYASVDESKPDKAQFNWGYDPKNYNVPEGSYATDPFNGEVRVREFKEMVKALHENGIRVIMDVVYNHTYASADSHLNKLVPGYYYRLNPDGTFANGSGCGNETASERSMVRKMIVDSVVYWATEYKVDGFRFDLMGLHDIETMRQIRKTLDQVDPSIIIYGEGWTGAASPLPPEQAALKANTYRLPGIAAFNDAVRDGIKGHVFNATEPGFVNGRNGMEESVKFGIVAATKHPQVNYDLVNYDKAPWAGQPDQSVVYCEAHDNLTLWDKLLKTNPEASEAERIKMHKLSGAMVLTSQGIPFLHAGQDFLRTKGGNENSYASPDSVNQLDWGRKAKYLDVYEYYKGLIELRKAHPAFRMRKTGDIQKNLKFMKLPAQMIGYILTDNANGDSWRTIVALFNGSTEAKKVKLPGRGWVVVVDDKKAGTKALRTITGDTVKIPARSAMVLVDRHSFTVAK